ncbi:MAG: hypothetical protein RI990_221, partial [Planctomycetota bacterium]
MTPMTVLLANADLGPKFLLITPEIVLFAGAVLCAVLGLSKSATIRATVPWVSLAALAATFVAMLRTWTPEAAAAAELPMPMLGKWVIALLCIVGAGHVLACMGSVDRDVEREVSTGRAAFDPVRVIRGE